MSHAALPADAVQASGLNVRRGRRHILYDLEFVLAPRRITGILGAPGSGKTTLLRTIVGAQRAESGIVLVLGLGAGHPDLRRRVGYLAQPPVSYPELTVEGNVRYFAALYGLGRTEARRAIADVGLVRHAGRRAGGLSVSDLRRTALACAVVPGPELLVLDEPTVGLEPGLRADLWQYFRQLADSGTTVLVSSQATEEAAHCDALLLLRDGRRLREGAA